MQNNTGTGNNTERERLICAEQLKLLYGGIPFAVPGHILGAALVLAVQWQVIAQAVLWWWFAAVVVTNLGRIVLAVAYRRRESDEQYKFWRRSFVFASGLASLSWASAGILLFPEHDLAHQTFIGFALVGLASGAIATHSFLRQAVFVFVVPIMLGMATGFFLTDSPIGIAISAAGILLLSILLISSNRIYRSTLQNIEFRLDSVEQSLALQHSKQRLRTILDTAADAFFLHDGEGRFVDVNKQACQGLGYSRQELLQLSVADVELRADEIDCQQCWDDLEKDKAVTLNGVHRCKDGTTFPVEVRLGALYEHGKKLYSVLARDVTERQQAEAALKLSEEQARAQYRGIPVPTYTWKKKGHDFELIDFNDAAECITDGAVANYIGTNLSVMYADNQVIQDDIWKCFKEQKPIQRQMRYYFKTTDKYKHLDVKYAFIPPDMVMIHTEDITARIRTEQLVHDNRAQLAEAQRMARLGNWDWDILTGQVTWSDEVYRILGYHKERDESSQDNFLNLVHPDDVKSVYESEQRAYQCESHFDKELRIITPDGELKYIHLRGELYFNEQQQAIRMVGTLQDVTERKQVEILKSEFISTVSHEIRTPLTSIMGSLSIMKHGGVGELSEDAHKMIRIAYENSQRLLVLINDILDISKIESGKMAFDFKPVEISGFIKQAIAANQGYAEHHHVKYIFESHLVGNEQVWGDKDRLMQVINNLLSNAAKFSPTGSTIDIQAGQQDNYIYIDVADRGPGIAADFADKIFERFTQHDASSQRVYGGTGLGLNISKHIVEKHNGEIGFRRRQEGGTIFYINLPILRERITTHPEA